MCGKNRLTVIIDQSNSLPYSNVSCICRSFEDVSIHRSPPLPPPSDKTSIFSSSSSAQSSKPTCLQPQPQRTGNLTSLLHDVFSPFSLAYSPASSLLTPPSPNTPHHTAPPSKPQSHSPTPTDQPHSTQPANTATPHPSQSKSHPGHTLPPFLFLQKQPHPPP